MDIEQLKSAALVRRNAGDFVSAEAMFRQAMAMAPDDVDCAHMVGVLCFRTGRAREAMHFFLRAGMLSEWKNAVVARNFGLALSFLHGDAVALQRIAYQTWLSARRRQAKPVTPLVTVIVPSYNHAAFIAAVTRPKMS
jgi:Flp pilus assembly protein TadD